MVRSYSDPIFRVIAVNKLAAASDILVSCCMTLFSIIAAVEYWKILNNNFTLPNATLYGEIKVILANKILMFLFRIALNEF